MRNKKGLSEIISYILILSLAVSLGTFIMVWYKGLAEKEVSGVLTPLEGTSQCDDVNINVVFNYDSCAITVYNTGNLAVKGLKITYADAFGGFNTTDYLDMQIQPRLNSGPIVFPIEGIDPSRVVNANIVPFVIASKQLYYCSKGYSFNTDGSEFSGC
jgi:hypothetical protein